MAAVEVKRQTPARANMPKNSALPYRREMVMEKNVKAERERESCMKGRERVCVCVV
jgi:hypothetical protein